MTFREFGALWEKKKLRTVQGLRWMMRYRTENGLMKCGAVIELRRPGVSRSKLFVNVPKFTAWFAGQGDYAD